MGAGKFGPFVMPGAARATAERVAKAWLEVDKADPKAIEEFVADLGSQLHGQGILVNRMRTSLRNLNGQVKELSENPLIMEIPVFYEKPLTRWGHFKAVFTASSKES